MISHAEEGRRAPTRRLRRALGQQRAPLFAVLAAAWSLLYATVATYWALGGGGFPFGEGDPEGADMGSLFVDLSARALAPPIVALCAAAAVVALAMASPGGGVVPRRVAVAVGWSMTALLVLAIPDVRLLRDFAYLAAGGAGFVEKFDWPAGNQLICLGGGLLWGAATLAYQRRTAIKATTVEHRAGAADERRWARRGRALTLAAVLLPVPYELTRWAWALGWPVGVTRGAEIIESWSGAERVGIFVFGAMPLLGGVLTHGLTQRWGETLPRWIPRIGGRGVPVALVVVPAALASILITTAAASLFRMWLNEALGRTPPATPDIEGWGAWVPGLFWLPWGLTLAGATYAYWRRRRAATRRLSPSADRSDRLTRNR
jgi:hypothetical protein